MGKKAIAVDQSVPFVGSVFIIECNKQIHKQKEMVFALPVFSLVCTGGSMSTTSSPVW